MLAGLGGDRRGNPLKQHVKALFKTTQGLHNTLSFSTGGNPSGCTFLAVLTPNYTAYSTAVSFGALLLPFSLQHCSTSLQGAEQGNPRHSEHAQDEWSRSSRVRKGILS